MYQGQTQVGRCCLDSRDPVVLVVELTFRCIRGSNKGDSACLFKDFRGDRSISFERPDSIGMLGGGRSMLEWNPQDFGVDG
jgi:hypothetical protein